MAIYEFGCGSCGGVIEKRQSFDDPFPTCERCGVVTTRLISLPAQPVFCGVGFYATDYGNMPHHLEPKDQRNRSRMEWHKGHMMVPRPRPISPMEKKQIKELSQRT